MKKNLLVIMLLALVFTACTTSKVSNADDAKKYVSTFLGFMDQKHKPNETEMMNCMALSFIESNHIKTDDFKVDNYSIWGFSIESYDATTGLVVTKVWGEARKWIHQLTYKVVKEKGKLCLMPSAFGEGYIEPWFEVKTYIKE
jgi:hypothetical protein